MMARARIGQRPPALRWSLPSLTEFIVYYQVLGFMKASVTHMTRYCFGTLQQKLIQSDRQPVEITIVIRLIEEGGGEGYVRVRKEGEKVGK